MRIGILYSRLVKNPLQRSGEVNREVKFDNSLCCCLQKIENDHLSSSYFHANALWMKLAMNPFTLGNKAKVATMEQEKNPSMNIPTYVL